MNGRREYEEFKERKREYSINVDARLKLLYADESWKKVLHWVYLME